MLRGLIIAAISIVHECLQSPKGNRLPFRSRTPGLNLRKVITTSSTMLFRGELDALKEETQAAFALPEK